MDTKTAPSNVPASGTTFKTYPVGKKQAAEFLASGYTRSKRLLEIASCIGFATVMIILIYRLIKATSYLYPTETVFILLFSILPSLATADFISGVVHWSADTWGDLSMPVFSTFIRSFREHHIDPVAMTRHDVIETNGDTFLACLPTLVLIARYAPLPGDAEASDFGWLLNRACYSFVCFMTVLAMFVALTNQIHKWAHTYRPPTWVRVLQQMHIILPPGEHAIHHKPPHDSHYCITNGWMNGPLQRIGFWRAAERVISSWTGAIPRRDDYSWMKTASAYADVPGAFDHPQKPAEKVE